MRFIFFSLIVWWLLSGCKNKEVDSEMFIGSYRISDQLIPYPFILQQNKDSLFLFNHTGLLIDKAARNPKDTSGFKFSKHHFQIFGQDEQGFFGYDLLDTITFKPLSSGGINFKDAAKFSKIAPDKTVDLQKLKNGLENSIWKYNVIEDENSNPNVDLDIEQLFQFRKDSVSILTSYFYQGLKTVSEHETKRYSIFEIDGNYFLSFHKDRDNPQPIFKISKYTSNKITFKDFSSREIKEIQFYKTSNSFEDHSNLIENANQYSNCFDGFQGEYYYGDDVTFREGNEFILEFVNIDSPKVDTGSGYIIVHFNINCRGDIGKFGLIQMDREFRKTSFPKELVHHLITKVGQLKDFPSTHSSIAWLQYKDVHGFLMFKLDNGKIIDLCP